jgi:hypothetical protein
MWKDFLHRVACDNRLLAILGIRCPEDVLDLRDSHIVPAG